VHLVAGCPARLVLMFILLHCFIIIISTIYSAPITECTYVHYTVTTLYKKLSYCCDSRSYCMQYFNAIHCDRNISTSELKNPFAVSPRIQQLLRNCVSNPQSAHLCLQLSAVAPCDRSTAPCHCWQTSRSFSTPSLSPIDTNGVSSTCQFVFFVLHFVAKRYILQKKCVKGQIGTSMLGTRWCNF